MREVGKLGGLIEKGYAQIFDRIESETYEEVFANVRNLILRRFFEKNEESKNEVQRDRVENQEEYKISLLEDINDFKLIFEILKEKQKNELERQRYIDGKFYELFFRAVEQNKDTKEIFKFIIEELGKNLNLTSEKIREYKAFAAQYLIQREKVSLFYDLFIREVQEDPLYSSILGKSLLETSGMKYHKGKLTPELYFSQRLFEFLSTIKVLPKGINGCLRFLDSPTLNYLIQKIKGRDLEILGHIFVKEKKKDNGNIDIDTFTDVLVHERRHAQYRFKNTKHTIYSRKVREIKDSITEKLDELRDGPLVESKIRELIFKAFFSLESEIKDEVIATISGSRIIKFLSESTPKVLESKLDYTRDEVEEATLDERIHYYLTPNADQARFTRYFLKYWKSSKTYMSLIKGIKKELGATSTEEKKLEEYIERSERAFLEALGNLLNKLNTLISRYPHQKDFILRYLEEVPLKEWGARIEELLNLLDFKHINNTSNL